MDKQDLQDILEICIWLIAAGLAIGISLFFIIVAVITASRW